MTDSGHDVYKCFKCNYTVKMKCGSKEYETFVRACPDCGNDALGYLGYDGLIATAIIPGSCTYNGKTKVVGSKPIKEKSRVPINIIDEMPNGTCKVTRIGTTDQEEGS